MARFTLVVSLLLLLFGIGNALNVLGYIYNKIFISMGRGEDGETQNNFIAKYVKILPDKVYKDIPKKLAEKIENYDKDHKDLTTSYTFPPEYQTTLYKDYESKTTLVNVFPTVETKTFSLENTTFGFQSLETSTTLLFEILNSTVEYPTPMFHSTSRKTIEYATPKYQHEILVYPTKINITQITSTSLVNYTRVDHLDNELNF